MGHVRRQEKARHVVKYVFSAAWATSSGKGPNDIFEALDVDIVANKKDAIHEERALVVEYQLSQFLAKVAGIGTQDPKLLDVYLQGTPGAVRLKRSARLYDGQAVGLAQVKKFGGCEGRSRVLS
jgi:hypothetical protein